MRSLIHGSYRRLGIIAALTKKQFIQSGVVLCILCILPILFFFAAAAEESLMDTSGYSLTSGNQKQAYDCVSFVNAWPESIRDEMIECFQTERVISGVYCIWHPFWGDDVLHVLAAIVKEDSILLVGAIRKDQWLPEVISDGFFEGAEEITIGMVPCRLRLSEIDSYFPAVICGTEWFCFKPVSDRIMFDHYERDKGENDDVSGELGVSVEIRPASDGSEMALYRYITESGGRVIWSGTLNKLYDWDHLNIDTYPKTLRDLQELCMPNG